MEGVVSFTGEPRLALVFMGVKGLLGAAREAWNAGPAVKARAWSRGSSPTCCIERPLAQAANSNCGGRERCRLQVRTLSACGLGEKRDVGRAVQAFGELLEADSVKESARV